MSDQTPKPENVPSYEDVERDLGPDMVGFMSEMLSEPGEPKESETGNLIGDLPGAVWGQPLGSSRYLQQRTQGIFSRCLSELAPSDIDLGFDF